MDTLNKLALALIGLTLMAVLFVGPIYVIWNYVLVDVVTWAKPVNFWQALGLAVLIGMLRPSSSSSSSSSKKEE